jgi:uncharacterized protein with NAD-binding domain and iron-sulfur cluster
MVKRNRDRVAVLGAGVAGLTAAHELAERRFDVTVIENRLVPGGKARSMPAGFEGALADLPAEHGFRFFPGFYRHVPDTMKRIPYHDRKRGETKTVFDNLVPAERITIARRGAPDIALPAHLPVSPWDLKLVLEAVFRGSNEVSPGDIAYFSERLLTLARACEERRYRELEMQSWWKFSGADSRSRSYQKFLADGLTRTLVAAQAKEMSARTGGYILLQLLSDLTRVGRSIDRVLNGPTSDVWIDPWEQYLRQLDVKFEFDTRVVSIECVGNHIDRISTRHPASSRGRGEPEGRKFDYYVVAVPLEVLVPEVVTPRLPGEGLLNDDLKKAAGLEELWKLKTRWMNGVLFYLGQDVPICRGHTLYIDSEWALTSISQQQFWRDVDLSQLGDGTIRGILSVDVSDWTTPGTNGKPAMACSPEEIKQEVWTQLKQHLNDDRVLKLVEDKRPQLAYIDQAIEWPNPTSATNLEPLLVNTAGSWNRRPEAVTAVENLFLAGDYVRTYTDLATMEGANEAGRRAVNGILEASGSPSEKCGVWSLREPLALAPVRAADRVWLEVEPHARQWWGDIRNRFRLGQP